MTQHASNKRYKKIKKLGEGTYGTVTKVFDNKQKKYIAVKKIKFQTEDETIPINALRQISSLRDLNHSNILKLYEISYQPEKQKLYLNFEYIDQTLYEYLRKNYPLSPFSIKTFIFQVLKGLNYLEKKSYMHRDLKPQNIMLTQEMRVKLIDFGQVRKFNPFTEQKYTLQISTLWYKAPQLLLGNDKYNNKIDIWSIGCIMAELAMGQPLFQGSSEIDQIFQIFKLIGTPKLKNMPKIKQWPHFNPKMPKFNENQIKIQILGVQGNDLLRKMLQIDPEKRISITKALKHEYFEGFE